MILNRKNHLYNDNKGASAIVTRHPTIKIFQTKEFHRINISILGKISPPKSVSVHNSRLLRKLL